MKKRHYLPALAAAGVFALVGCEQNASTEATEETETAAAEGAAAAETETVSLKVSGMT